MSLFGATGLGARVQAANSFDDLCSLQTPRNDVITLPTPVTAMAMAAETTPAAAAPDTAPPDPAANAFSRIAMSLDLATRTATPLPPVAAAHPAFSLPAAHALRTQQQTYDYIQAVAERVQRLRPVRR